MTNLNEFKKFINELADISGEVIRKYYRNFGEYDLKSDHSIVTIADKETEQAIRSMITKTYPSHGILGEEFGGNNMDSEYIWTIDPIDGTSSFAIGRPTFGTLISLSKSDEFILGIINQPINNERWIGSSDGSYFNGRKISVRKCADISSAIITTTGPNYFSKEKLAIFNNVAGRSGQQVYGGDCYLHGLLAMGTIDIIIESGLKPHDFCAVVPIIENAGGIITDWQGNKLTISSDGDIIACGDKKIHEQVLSMLR